MTKRSGGRGAATSRRRQVELPERRRRARPRTAPASAKWAGAGGGSRTRRELRASDPARAPAGTASGLICPPSGDPFVQDEGHGTEKGRTAAPGVADQASVGSRPGAMSSSWRPRSTGLPPSRADDVSSRYARPVEQPVGRCRRGGSRTGSKAAMEHSLDEGVRCCNWPRRDHRLRGPGRVNRPRDLIGLALASAPVEPPSATHACVTPGATSAISWSAAASWDRGKATTTTSGCIGPRATGCSCTEASKGWIVLVHEKEDGCSGPKPAAGSSARIDAVEQDLAPTTDGTRPPRGDRGSTCARASAPERGRLRLFRGIAALGGRSW